MFDRALNMILHSFSSIETAGTENWQKFNEIIPGNDKFMMDFS